MTSSRARYRSVFCLVLGLGLGLGACSKDPKGGAVAPPSAPAPFGPQRAQVDPARIAVPPLLAHVPTDTPYIMASLEPIPLAFFAKLKHAVGPAVGEALEALRATDAEFDRFAAAVLHELDGKWTANGLEDLGLSAEPRFALYGLGALPMVVRIELKDAAVLLATVERVARNAGLALPALETRDGRKFWRIPLDGDLGAVISLGDGELVAAFGPRPAIAAALPLILGSENPPDNMADASELKAAMVAHGFGPRLIGYVDARRLASAVLAIAEIQVPPACRGEIEQLTGRAPRIVFGYSEFTATRAVGGAVIELAPDLVAELAALKVVVPGLATAMAGRPLMAFGGGIDLGRAQALGRVVAARLSLVGERCESRGMARAGRELAAAMSTPLPAKVGTITGAVVSVDAITLAPPGAFPVSELEAFGMLFSAAPRELFAFFLDQAPPLRSLGIKADGALHAVDVSAMGLPFGLFAGVGDRAIVVAAGDRGRAAGDRALGVSAGGKAPFLVMNLDYGRVLAIQAQVTRDRLGIDDPAANLSASVNARLAAIYGRSEMSMDVTDKGLQLWGSVELK